MRRALYALVAALFLAGPALAEEAAPKAPDLPFEFIPREFQGKWVLTKYQFPPIGPTEPTDPDYFIGKIIEIKNNSVIFFGHACETFRITLQHRKGDPRYSDFDKGQIPDADIKEIYPYVRDLTVFCGSGFDTPPQGPEALFLSYEGHPIYVYFGLYDPSARFITTSMSNGPRYILRPVE